MTWTTRLEKQVLDLPQGETPFPLTMPFKAPTWQHMSHNADPLHPCKSAVSGSIGKGGAIFFLPDVLVTITRFLAPSSIANWAVISFRVTGAADSRL